MILLVAPRSMFICKNKVGSKQVVNKEHILPSFNLGLGQNLDLLSGLG